MNNIQLAHGSGGQAMQQRAREGDRLAFSTDSYVIDPLFFPGGNIGKLAICGTANDVAVSGAIPRYLSCGCAGSGYRHCNRRHQSCAARRGG